MSREAPSEGSIEGFRESIFESFSAIRDPRILGKPVRHELTHICVTGSTDQGGSRSAGKRLVKNFFPLGI